MKKRTFILLGLLLISAYTFAQAPNWQWATQAGGPYYDRGCGITIDDAGNSYVTGWFYGTATFGSYTLTSSGITDIFVAKMDAVGNWLWVTQAGGISFNVGCGITIDNADPGNSYVTGQFVGTATFGSYFLTSRSCDIFVAKLNSLVSVDDEIIPTEIGLSNYPNPFNPTTTINYQLQEDSEVELIIYNIKGQKVKTLVNELLPAGEHSAIWNGRDSNSNQVCSGIYFYKLKAGDYQKVKKMILLK